MNIIPAVLIGFFVFWLFVTVVHIVKWTKSGLKYGILDGVVLGVLAVLIAYTL